MGSPAHAGIDLCAVRECPLDARFPRTRGDRPWKGFLRSGDMRVPPHTRG